MTPAPGGLTVPARLYRYSGGLAQFVGDGPEPRVSRWADVRDFTVHYFEADDAAPGCPTSR